MKVIIGETTYTKLTNLVFDPVADVTGTSVPINEFSVDIKTDDDIDAMQYAWLYDDTDKLWAKYWIVYADRMDTTTVSIKAQSPLKLLERRMIDAAMFSDEPAEDVIADIFDELGENSYTLDESFANATLSGYAPYQSCKNRLQWVCFVLGAYIKSCFNEKIEILPVPTEPKLIPLEKTKWRPALTYSEYRTRISVTAYSYEQGTPATTDAWVEDKNGVVYIQTQLNHGLRNTEVPEGTLTHEAHITDVTLVNDDNVDDILSRLGPYYFKRMKAQIEVINNADFIPGDFVNFYIDEKTIAQGHIEKADFSFGLQAASQLDITPVETSIVVHIDITITTDEDGNIVMRPYPDGEGEVIYSNEDVEVTLPSIIFFDLRYSSMTNAWNLRMPSDQGYAYIDGKPSTYKYWKANQRVSFEISYKGTVIKIETDDEYNLVLTIPGYDPITIQIPVHDTLTMIDIASIEFDPIDRKWIIRTLTNVKIGQQEYEPGDAIEEIDSSELDDGVVIIDYEITLDVSVDEDGNLTIQQPDGEPITISCPGDEYEEDVLDLIHVKYDPDEGDWIITADVIITIDGEEYLPGDVIAELAPTESTDFTGEVETAIIFWTDLAGNLNIRRMPDGETKKFKPSDEAYTETIFNAVIVSYDPTTGTWTITENGNVTVIQTTLQRTFFPDDVIEEWEDTASIDITIDGIGDNDAHVWSDDEGNIHIKQGEDDEITVAIPDDDYEETFYDLFTLKYDPDTDTWTITSDDDVIVDIKIDSGDIITEITQPDPLDITISGDFTVDIADTLTVNCMYHQTRIAQLKYTLPIAYPYEIDLPALDQLWGITRYVFVPETKTITGQVKTGGSVVEVDYILALGAHKGTLLILAADEIQESNGVVTL